MQLERKRPLPENLRLKQERSARVAQQAKEAKTVDANQAKENKVYYLAQGKKHFEAYQTRVQSEIDAKRAAKSQGQIYVPAEPKLILVIRIKGINKLDPKRRKILQLLRLRQINNAVFLKSNKPILNMLRMIEPYVTYGIPSHAVIRQLIYKRGNGKIDRQRIPFSDNRIIEKGLGALGIKCVEDLINEIETVGPNFKKANNFIWPFKLNSPKGGLKQKRTPYLNGGSHGNRGAYINAFVKKML